MATAIRMPDFGETDEEFKLARWLKQEGQPVARGEILCEVETEKACGELESPEEGVLLRQAVPAGGLAKADQIIAYVGRAGETDLGDQSPGLGGAGGTDLGRETPRSGGPGRLTENQLAVIRTVTRSQRQVVPFDLVCRIDMTAATALRQRLQAEGKKVSYDAIFIHAAAQVIKDFPHFRSHLARGRLVVGEGIHVAFAAGFRNALYLLVVRQADQKSPAEIEQELDRLVTKAAARQVELEDMAGACFGISNLGMYPIQSFNVVVPPNQSAAMAVGATEETPICREGKIVVAPLAAVTLTVDHRMINGREAGQFLARLKEVMEKL